MPSHLEMTMRQIWHQNGGSKGISTQVAAKKKTEIILNALREFVYV